MKKNILLFTFVLFFLIPVFKVYSLSDNEEVLMNHYIPSIPLRYKSNNEVITVPKKVDAKHQQFRGVMVYTDNNLDFNQVDNIEDFKTQYINILDTMENSFLNTVIFEVRPNNDAFYPSKLNPWSKYLTGTEDTFLKWDPLKWMIDETHSRGFTFYASFNLYKLSDKTNLDKEEFINTLSAKNFAYQNRDAILQMTDISYQNQYLLNPASESVKDFVFNSIMEVIQKYNIDAINIEDSFYPMYGSFDDNSLYKESTTQYKSIENFRRYHVTDLIKNLHKEIDYYNIKNNKHVQFGLTAYGNYETSFNFEFADTKQWIHNEYIDYIIPLLKWDFEDTKQPYADRVDWWADAVSETKVNLYTANHVSLKDANQVLDQLRFNDNYDEVKGSLLVGYHGMKQNDNEEISNFIIGLKDKVWYNLSLHPKVPLVDDNPPTPVSRLLIKYVDNKVNLSWKNEQDAAFYLVYRFDVEDDVDLNDNNYIIKIIQESTEDKIKFIDETIEKGHVYRYIIVSMDKGYNESQPVTFDIDLNPNEMFEKEMTAFIILSSSAFLVIGFTAFKVLLKK